MNRPIWTSQINRPSFIPFDRRRFKHISQALSLAIYDLSLESRASPFLALKQDLRNVVAMGLEDIKARLSHIPGIDNLTMRTGPNGTEHYRIGDHEVDIPAGNAARRSRVQYIADGFATVAQPIGFMSMDEPTTETTPTALPVVDIVPQKPAMPVVVDPLRRNVTGAAGLGSSVENLIAAIKREVDAAHSDLHAAAGEVRTGISTVKGVAKALRTEADDIKSSLGQFSNGGPE